MEYIDAEKLRSEVERVKETGCASPILVCDDILMFIDYLKEEQSKSRLIQVKCVKPHDTSWETDKVYICEMWHHGDMDMDFYDVYYDYGNNPNYVQFTNIKMLNEEFIFLKQEHSEVDLEKEIQDKIYNLFFDLEGIAIIGTSTYASVADMEFIARHFYQLGIENARKEEKQCKNK